VFCCVIVVYEVVIENLELFIELVFRLIKQVFHHAFTEKNYATKH